MIALFEAHRAGLLGRSQWLPNLVAGVIVGVVALPLAMAFAIASGVRPEQGLYTAIIAGGLTTILGGSRVQISGPTGAFIVILAGITAQYGIAGLQVATIMAGVILLLMGIARMGRVIKFIPRPVIAGFTAGIGVIIFVGQWRDFFGLPAIEGTHFHEKLLHLLQALPQLNVNTLVLAMIGLTLVIFSPRIRGLQRIPGPLVAMVLVTLLQATFHLTGVATIGSTFGTIPSGLPTFALPDLSVPQMIMLIGPAFTIAMLGAIESLLSAVVADGMTGTRHDSNQELMGQGIANIAAPLFGGIAATGAIARTATNIRNGATSPIAGLMHVLTLVAVVLFLAPLASSIPLAVLAAILFVVAWNMSDLKHCAFILRKAPNADKAILLITFLLTVFADLVVAVNVGVILAMLHFMSRMADSVETAPVDDHDLQADLQQLGLDKLPDGVVAYEIEGPMFFAAVENLQRALLATQSVPVRLILRLRHVPFMDITGITSLAEVIDTLEKRGSSVVLCEAKARVYRKLRRAGVIDTRDSARYAQTFTEALGLGRLTATGSPDQPTGALQV